jgi:type II secretion system protein H
MNVKLEIRSTLDFGVICAMASDGYKFRLRLRRDGFTLFELVLVLLVVALIAATVVPAMRNFAHGRRLGDAATQIVALANYARTQAIAEGKTYRLNLDMSAGTYALTARTYDAFEDLGNDYGELFQVPEGMRLDCNFSPQQDGLYVTFHPNGRTDAGDQPAGVDSLVIKLVDDDGNQKQIVCQSPTELFQIVD